jgi:hypothetical protein
MDVPTKRARHMITETDDVAAALDALRRRGAKIDLPALVIRGAESELNAMDNKLTDTTDRHERQRAAMARAAQLVDVEQLLGDTAWQ